MFGLKCTTFGCELDNTKASRIATTVPLNITQLLNSSEPVPGNQSNTTIFTSQEPNINSTSVASMADLTTSTEEEVMSTNSYNRSPTGVSSANTSVRGSSSIQVASIISPTGVSSASTSVRESSSIQVASIISLTRVYSASTSVRGSSTSSIQVTSTPTASATSSVDSLLAEELESAISNVSSIVSTLRNFHVFSLQSCLR